MKRLAVLVSSFGYAGYSPVAPGTAGSAAGLVLFALVRWTGSTLAEGLVLVAVAVAGIWSASATERYLHVTDPGLIVVDEVLGMLLTLAFLPISWPWAVVGFFLFRALDIVKPFPANVAERLHGGVGVMADDMVAGVYGNVILRAALALSAPWL